MQRLGQVTFPYRINRRAAYHVAHFCCLHASARSRAIHLFLQTIRPPTYITSHSRGTTAPRTGEWSLEIKLPMSKTDKSGQGPTRLFVLFKHYINQSSLGT